MWQFRGFTEVTNGLFKGRPAFHVTGDNPLQRETTVDRLQRQKERGTGEINRYRDA